MEELLVFLSSYLHIKGEEMSCTVILTLHKQVKRSSTLGCLQILEELPEAQIALIASDSCQNNDALREST